MVPLTRRRRVPAWVASFQYRDFRYLWLSSVVQSVGMGMEFVALGWLVLDMTGSPLWVGVASAARMLPFFVMGFVSGAVADRVDRRIFVRWMTLAGAGVAALTALVLYVDYAPDWTVPVLNVAYNPGLADHRADGGDGRRVGVRHDAAPGVHIRHRRPGGGAERNVAIGAEPAAGAGNVGAGGGRDTRRSRVRGYVPDHRRMLRGLDRIAVLDTRGGTGGGPDAGSACGRTWWVTGKSCERTPRCSR